MSEKEVDLSQIRGDWDFHSRYVTHALDQTLKRANKYWRELKKASTKKDQVPVEGELLEEFIEALAQAKAMTDDFYILAETQQGSKKAGKRKAKKKSKKKAKKKAQKKAKKKSAKKGGQK